MHHHSRIIAALSCYIKIAVLPCSCGYFVRTGGDYESIRRRRLKATIWRRWRRVLRRKNYAAMYVCRGPISHRYEIMKLGAGKPRQCHQTWFNASGEIVPGSRYILVLTNKNDYHMELAAKVELQSLD